jgi:hypothetical protein
MGLSEAQLELLARWIGARSSLPAYGTYPPNAEREKLCGEAGLERRQLDNWLYRHRQRRMAEEEAEEEAEEAEAEAGRGRGGGGRGGEGKGGERRGRSGDGGGDDGDGDGGDDGDGDGGGGGGDGGEGDDEEGEGPAASPRPSSTAEEAAAQKGLKQGREAQGWRGGGGSRYDASLTVLARRLMALLQSGATGTEGGGGGGPIILDANDASVKLDVKKRRIYDITNVLEGIGLVEKRSKNVWIWRGLEGCKRAMNDAEVGRGGGGDGDGDGERDGDEAEAADHRGDGDGDGDDDQAGGTVHRGGADGEAGASSIPLPPFSSPPPPAPADPVGAFWRGTDTPRVVSLNREIGWLREEEAVLDGWMGRLRGVPAPSGGPHLRSDDLTEALSAMARGRGKGGGGWQAVVVRAPPGAVAEVGPAHLRVAQRAAIGPAPPPMPLEPGTGTGTGTGTAEALPGGTDGKIDLGTRSGVGGTASAPVEVVLHVTGGEGGPLARRILPSDFGGGVGVGDGDGVGAGAGAGAGGAGGAPLSPASVAGTADGGRRTKRRRMEIDRLCLRYDEGATDFFP